MSALIGTSTTFIVCVLWENDLCGSDSRAALMCRIEYFVF